MPTARPRTPAQPCGTLQGRWPDLHRMNSAQPSRFSAILTGPIFRRNHMKDQELRERIGIWFGEHGQRPLPPPQSQQSAQIQAALEAAWAKTLLSHVTEMTASPGIQGAQAEKDLAEAVRMAKTGDPKYLPRIKESLDQVFAALQKAPATPSTDYIEWKPPLKPTEDDQ